MLVINSARFCDVVLRNGFAHSLHVRVCLVARHVNGYNAQTSIMMLIAPFRDALHVLLADTTTHCPEMHERRLPLRLCLRMSLRRTEPLGRPVKLRHLSPNPHWHDEYLSE